MKIPYETLWEFCKDHYYCDPEIEGGIREVWEPFSSWEESEIEEQISIDVDALQLLLEGKYKVKK